MEKHSGTDLLCLALFYLLWIYIAIPRKGDLHSILLSLAFFAIGSLFFIPRIIECYKDYKRR